MNEKTLEELVAFARSDKGHMTRGFVGHVRSTPEPRETWAWIQGLLIDKGNTVVDVGKLLHKQMPFSAHYSVPASMYTPIGSIRKLFLGVKITMSDTSKAMHARKVKQEIFGKKFPETPAQAPKSADKMRERLMAALDLGLSKDVLASVVTDIIKHN